MKKIRNLIFDLDGTLIDSSAGVIEAVNYALEQTGEPVVEGQVIKGYIGSPLNQMFADFTDQPYPTLLRFFRERAIHSVVASTELLSGVQPTLEKLHIQGYQMGIATTKVIDQVEAIMQRLDWDQFFIARSGGDEVEQVKPAPDIFLLSLKRMNCRAEDSIVIGDTANDVYGARSADLRVIAVPSEFGSPEDLAKSKPDYLIERFDQLPALLNQLETEAN